MKFNIRNTILSCLALLGMSSSVSAQDYYSSNDYSCNPCCSDMGRIIVGADWLYWKAEQDGLNYGVLETSTVTTTDTLTSTVSEEQILKPYFKYDSGYRVFLGYEIPCYDWEFSIIYTHAPNVRCRNSRLTTATPPLPAGTTQNIVILENSLFNSPDLAIDDSVDTITAAKARWGLDFDYVDWDLAHTLCLSDYLRVRPHTGIRYMWGKQNFNLNFIGTNFTPAAVSFTGHLQNRSWGVGVEGGLWGDWEVGSGFSILGHVGGAILYGKHKVRGDQTLATAPGVIPATEILRAYRDTEFAAIPMLDYFIGVQYVASIMEYAVDFHIGWEQHVAFDMNRFTTTDGGDLSLQGLTMGLAFAF